MPGFHDITAAIVGAGFIGPVHVEGLRRLGIRVKGIAGISHDEATRAQQLLAGEVPSAMNPPAGCRFHPRCPKAMAQCATVSPRLQEVSPGRAVACHLHPVEDGEDGASALVRLARFQADGRRIGSILRLAGGERPLEEQTRFAGGVAASDGFVLAGSSSFSGCEGEGSEEIRAAVALVPWDASRAQSSTAFVDGRECDGGPVLKGLLPSDIGALAILDGHNQNLQRFLDYREQLHQQNMSGLLGFSAAEHEAAHDAFEQRAAHVSLDVSLVIDTYKSIVVVIGILVVIAYFAWRIRGGKAKRGGQESSPDESTPSAPPA